MGKSAAKIRRNTLRAIARGETYVPPEPTGTKRRRSAAATANDDDDDDDDDNVVKDGGEGGGHESEGGGSENDEMMIIAPRSKVMTMADTAHTKLERTLATLDDDDDAINNPNARDRRSALKRKASSASASASASKFSDADMRKIEAAKRLRGALARLEVDGDMNAKERRSAKRRAEAIASEEIGGEDAGGLLEWYDTMVAPNSKKDAANGAAKRGKKIPYILFVGQLSYDTTSDVLFEHFRSALGSEAITKESVKIRLLVDTKKKKNKSRGMAFVELDSPELMYECLKLHLTHLDGRRINVERSAGGGAAAKKSRISSFRESQSNYISETMDGILSSFVKNGEITSEELDEGVIGLCKRHSATVVESALKEYVQEKRERKVKRDTLGEKEDEELRNPSAFLTHMIGRIAEEGIGNSSKGKNRGRGGDDDGGRGRGRGRDGGRGGGRGGGPGRGGGGSGRKVESSSILQRSGVDMSISSRDAGNGGERSDDISRIFPSMKRGRGRGRGYM